MSLKKRIGTYLNKPRSIAPLVTFRILFGLLMAVASIRFWAHGWIETLFIEPDFFFKYYGFHWVEALPPLWMKGLFAFMILSALGIALGLFYRFSVIGFLLSFSYFELLDATNYLNHHYLVILFALLLLIVPAHRAVSLDLYLKRTTAVTQIPAWCILVFCFQIGIVYTFAGIAKLNADWLLRAMPLAIWLPERAGYPLIGPLLELPITAYIFSWFGAIYDCCIFWFLMNRKTRPYAYGAVVLFHVMTGILFNIGIFPAIMILSNLIFFSDRFHERIYGSLLKNSASPFMERLKWKPLGIVFMLFFAIQILFPLRHLLYPKPTVYSEEGYRFSWRVMLLEKAGVAQFIVKDAQTGRWMEVDNRRYLTEFQEKQMAIQPDFMLQYARFLEKEFTGHLEQPEVYVQSHITLNGRLSERLVDPSLNLLSVEDDLRHKDWLLPERK